MSGFQLNYSGEELRQVCRHTLTPDFFGYNANDDMSDTINILVADTYQVFKPDVSHLDVFITEEFSYNQTTGEITYSGDGEMYSITGTISLGECPSNNTVVHFALARTRDSVKTYLTEASTKLKDTTSINVLSLSRFFNAMTGDIFTIEVKSTDTGNHEAYHVQGFIVEHKPSLYE